MSSAAPADDRLKQLIEAALWEIADESSAAPEHTDALDSMIDAARANLMGGMMPDEAELLFGVTNGPLGRSSFVAPHHVPVAVAPPVPTQSPSSVLTPPNDGDDLAHAIGTMAVQEGNESPSARDFDEEWEAWPSEDDDALPAVPPPPTPAERAAAARAAALAAASERLAQERARVQRSSNVRNRAAEKAAEKAAETAAEDVLAKLPSRPTE
jgi:hypothetical protein